MSKQDRQGVRLPAEVERKWNFKKRFGEAMDVAAEASDAVDKLDEAMDQTEIFNRLTNHGKAQGLFLDEEGNVFINASFLTTGILKSLDGKTFYLDLVKGILRGQFEEFSIAGKTVEQIASDASNKAQQYADQAAKDAVNSQTQTDVFNKLTNNGTAQGIYYRNGQLYINASYLAAGILKTLDSTTFYLDLAKNNLKILGKTVSWQENEDGTYTLVGK
jgi:hypothetical protein